ncbi:MAG: hypothetical protein VX483_00435, partial [Candidatus Thermoplasmatota archaeon]|nr:hypothetical protein [Candidatus Thermoplasmatota archaeon]
YVTIHFAFTPYRCNISGSSSIFSIKDHQKIRNDISRELLQTFWLKIIKLAIERKKMLIKMHATCILR